MSVLEVREASFAYGRREVFHDVSFQLPDRKSVV